MWEWFGLTINKLKTKPILKTKLAKWVFKIFKLNRSLWNWFKLGQYFLKKGTKHERKFGSNGVALGRSLNIFEESKEIWRKVVIKLA